MSRTGQYGTLGTVDSVQVVVRTKSKHRQHPLAASRHPNASTAVAPSKVSTFPVSVPVGIGLVAVQIMEPATKLQPRHLPRTEKKPAHGHRFQIEPISGLTSYAQHENYPCHVQIPADQKTGPSYSAVAVLQQLYKVSPLINTQNDSMN